MGHPEVPAGEPKPDNPDGLTLTRSYLATIRRAIGEGWSVPDAMRNETLYAMCEILSQPNTKFNRRLKLSVARTLAILDKADTARSRAGKTGLRIADLVAEAEAAAASYRAPERPEPVALD
jgi:hypothetical protein